MEDYKKRMVTEYRELKERTDKLEIMLNVMKNYVGILETKAKIKGIDLTDEVIVDKTRRKYDCNHDCDALYEAYQKGREDALSNLEKKDM